MKYKNVARTVAELRELADFFEERGVRLPDGYYTPQLTLYLTESDYVKNEETGEYESVLNEQKTRENLRKLLQGIGSCEKDYKDDRIAITKKYKSSGRTMVTATVDRSLACKRVVTGQKFEQALMIPAKLVDEVEWVCDEGVSLLKLVEEV